MSLRSGRNINAAAASASNQRKGSAGSRLSRRNKQRQQPPSPEQNHDDPNDHQRPQDSRSQSSTNQDKPHKFVSSFPSLSFENMEQELDKWTLVDLRNALTQEKKNRSRHKNQAHPEIDNLVKLIRLDYEKRMLMAALIGGISETMVWSLVDAGPQKGKSSCWSWFLSFGIAPLGVKMPHRDDKAGWAIRNKQLRDLWDDMSIDEKTVFKSPYFFALAKLPDLSNPSLVAELEDDDQDSNEEDVLAQVSSTPVHQLSEEDKLRYRPLFNRLVDIEKVHANHGKPQSTDSTASLQLKSLAGFRAAHHKFATACQRFHIHYYLSALSCDITNNGWNEVYSTNKSFAEWADETMSLTTKFRYYVHGKAVARVIKKKPPQPVDARRAELTRELNRLIGQFNF
ncbi:hypothetical protein DFH28DRAFT_882150 [Melampsora americana]|nr:hypothetical protein DFH28DRAFT_882150 [Melampsora americana]